MTSTDLTSLDPCGSADYERKTQVGPWSQLVVDALANATMTNN